MGKFYVNTATLNQQSRALSDVSDGLRLVCLSGTSKCEGAGGAGGVGGRR